MIKRTDISLIRIENSECIILNIKSTYPTSDTSYTLTKQSRVSDNVWTLDENGNLDKSSSDPDYDGVFTDNDLSTSVTLTYCEKTDKYSIEGILNNTWIISPQKFRSPPATCDMCLPIVQHTLTPVEMEIGGADYELLPESTTVYEDPLEDLPLLERDQYIISAQTSSVTKYPEILITVDYSLHKKLGENKARTRQYVEKHFNSVNSMFAKLSEPKVKLVLAGVIIGTSALSLPFLHHSGSYSTKFEANTALSGMGKYYYSKSGILPKHDLVVALTAQDMQTQGSSGVIGLAYVGGACAKDFRQTRSVAIVEDKGTYNGVTTAAHEIGHLLGVVHDGDGAANYLGGSGAISCGQGFLMSPLANGSNRWSDCSEKQLRNFLISRRANCLNNKPSGVGGDDSAMYPETTTTYKPDVVDRISVVNEVNIVELSTPEPSPPPSTPTSDIVETSNNGASGDDLIVFPDTPTTYKPDVVDKIKKVNDVNNINLTTPEPSPSPSPSTPTSDVEETSNNIVRVVFSTPELSPITFTPEPSPSPTTYTSEPSPSPSTTTSDIVESSKNIVRDVFSTPEPSPTTFTPEPSPSPLPTTFPPEPLPTISGPDLFDILGHIVEEKMKLTELVIGHFLNKLKV